MSGILRYKVAVLYFCLFSVNALAMAVVSALSGADWGGMSGTQKTIVIFAVLGNWTNVVLAFLSKAAKMDNGIPAIDTTSAPGAVNVETKQ